MPFKLFAFLLVSFFFTIDASAQLNGYSTVFAANTASTTMSMYNSASTSNPSVVSNSVRDILEVINLPGKIHQAFVADKSGNAVMKLTTSTSKWKLSPTKMSTGLYSVIIHSGSQWFTLRFDYTQP